MRPPVPDDSMIVLSEDRTDPAFGRPPLERGVAELFQKGAVLLDKTRGPTSHQVVSWLKKVLDVEKAGHLGTLDPKTTGVLPVALGNAVRSLQVTLEEGKEYVAVMQLHGDLKEDAVRSIASEFTGEIYQLVPVRAAVKRGLRTRHIEYLKVLEKSGRQVLLLIGCESGTYIRTLIHDLGEVLGTGAHMAELRRTRSGCIDESMCCTLQQLKDAYEIFRKEGDERPLREVVHPVEVLMERTPHIYIKDSSVDAICHGAPLGMPGISMLHRSLKKDGVCIISTLKGEAVALARAEMDGKDMANRREGVAATITRVLMDTGVYPRSWKRRSKQ
ncbi:MAG: RNA-guided pseudouridylation complex pseudouridine synthase subunit Cbf5 [Candidatus Thermoplasmatota archaeon]|nr:RNA-guided pseudouridylation complex pseudouridine synthase subunit Cbf5 [Candidatus Thermoplasmatota archaeon]